MTDEAKAAVPESPDDELARLRRLAIVDELLRTLVGVLDVREVFAQVKEVAGRVLKHDAATIVLSTFGGLLGTVRTACGALLSERAPVPRASPAEGRSSALKWCGP